jgi:hypothetical protein
MHGMSKKSRSRTADKRDPKTVAFWGFMAGALVVGAGGLVYDSSRANADDSYVSNYTPAPVVDPVIMKAAFLGDSYTAPAAGYAGMTAQEMCWQYLGFGQGGTGYINPGQPEEGDKPFPDRVPDIIAAHPDVVIMQGSTNDVGSDRVQDVATRTIAALQDGLPDAKIVVVGPVVPPKFTADQVSPVRNQLVAATAERGVPFIDPIALGFLPNPKHFVDDQIHPTEAGHLDLRDSLVPHLRAIDGLNNCLVPAGS